MKKLFIIFVDYDRYKNLISSNKYMRIVGSKIFKNPPAHTNRFMKSSKWDMTTLIYINNFDDYNSTIPPHPPAGFSSPVLRGTGPGRWKSIVLIYRQPRFYLLTYLVR